MSSYPVSIIIGAIDKASEVLGVITDNVAGLETEVKKTAKVVKPLGIALTAVGTAGLALSTSSVLLSARVEELGVVLGVLGSNVGYTDAQIDSIQERVESLGITSISTSQSLVRMIQANIDLASATDLARLAQDAAVIGQMDSSAAFERLIMVVQRGSPLMARRLGLNVSFNDAYKEQARLLGITVAELSQKQKVMARVNAVLKAGSRVTGAYEAAMTTSAKMLRTMNRLWVEARIALGDGLLPVMTEAVDISTWLLESFNDLNPAIKSIAGSTIGLVSTLALLSGGFILLAPKILATVTLLQGMPAFLSAVASSMSVTAAATAAASGGTLTLAASLGVILPVAAAVVASLAAIAAALKFGKDKAEGYDAMHSQLTDALEDEAVAGASAADMVQTYVDRRAHANKVIQESAWYVRMFIDDQKVMTLSYEELLAVVGRNITSTEEFAQVQQLIQEATEESTESVSTLTKTIHLAGEAFDIFKQTYAEASEEGNFFARTSDAIARSLNYAIGAVGNIDKAHKDLTRRNQVLGTSFEDLQKAIEAENMALEDETETARAAVASSERMMDNLKRAMDWNDILQSQNEYHAKRADAYLEARDDFLELEEEHNRERQNILQSSEEAINAAYLDYRKEKADIFKTSEEKLHDLHQKYNEDVEKAQDTHNERMFSIAASYTLRRTRAQEDADRGNLEKEENHQDKMEDVVRTTAEKIAEIEEEFAKLEYETESDRADRVAVFKDDAARAEKEAKELVSNAQNMEEKDAAKLRLRLLQEENAETLREMENNQVVLAGITQEERDEQIAALKAERDKRLALIEEEYERERQLREEKLRVRLARLEEDGQLALQAEEKRISDRLVALEEEFGKRNHAQEEHFNKRMLSLEEEWRKEQAMLNAQRTERLEQETVDYEATKTQLGESLTSRLDMLEENWVRERTTWKQHWAKLEVNRLAAMLKNKEMTLNERNFIEGAIGDIARQFGLVTPEALTFAETEFLIRDATNQAAGGTYNSANAFDVLHDSMMWANHQGLKLYETLGKLGMQQPPPSFFYPGEYPSHQHGTDNVPRTGLAMLHEGEAVLPRHKAQEYRQGDMGGKGTIVNIYGLTLSGVQHATDLISELRNLAIGNEYV